MSPMLVKLAVLWQAVACVAGAWARCATRQLLGCVFEHLRDRNCCVAASQGGDVVRQNVKGNLRGSGL
jgi:hypothetical protein